MQKKIKLTPFDPVDFLTSEIAIEEYILAMHEEGASERLLEKAYRDIERARIVHGIPKRDALAV